VGTSVNQASPHTLSWTAAQAGYRDAEVPISRLASEVWRAALNQESGNIAQLIAQPIIARLGNLAVDARSAADVTRATALAIAASKESSLATDIARRAAVQCVSASVSDRFAKYSERVFAEATAYLVSRDLPGFVGNGRARTVADSMELKSALTDHVADVARGVDRPASSDARLWAKYVNTVVQRLRGLK
jgi:hypothetical protein